MAPAADAAAGADVLFIVPDALAARDAAPDLGAPPDLAAADAEPLSACATPLSAPLRRLTRTQYLRTVRELTGLTVTTELPGEAQLDGFEDRADQLTIDDLRVSTWHKAADEVVGQLLPGVATLVACPGAIDAACARAFIESFGRRAYRRPLEPAEVDAHLALFTRVRDLGDASDGIGAVLRVMLQSPHFLYRLQLGGRADDGRLGPTPWEVAARLSYLLWGNMPDAALFMAAQAGELSTPAQVTAQARRMLLDQRARQGANDFFRQWLGLDGVLEAHKDLTVVPDWDSAVAPALREEGFRFTQRVLFDADGRFGSLFTATEATVNGRLARLYGLTANGDDWQQVALAGQPRLGLLTQGWFLAHRARGADSSPTMRGNFVRGRLLCQLVPPEPPDVPPPGPVPPPTSTTRERYRAHADNPSCAACHTLMDPLGFPFEAYDGLAVFRRTENGKPIDTSGLVTGTDVDGPVIDAMALSRRLAGSDQARACFAGRWYEQAVGHERSQADACRAGELERAFRTSDGNMRQLMVDVATLTALAPRPAGEVVEPRPTQPLVANPGEVEKMVLDLIGSQVAQLRSRLTLSADRERLDQHLAGLRSLERSLP
jgi:hypothetical protein